MSEKQVQQKIEEIRAELSRYSKFVKRSVELLNEAIEALEKKQDLQPILITGARELNEIIAPMEAET